MPRVRSENRTDHTRVLDKNFVPGVIAAEKHDWSKKEFFEIIVQQT